MKLLLLQNGVRRVSSEHTQGSTGTRSSIWREDQQALGSYVRCSILACARIVPSHELREHAIRDHPPRFLFCFVFFSCFCFFLVFFFSFSFRFFLFFFFGTPTHVSAAMAILANAMVGHGGMPELYNLKPVLNWANICSPNILRTVRRTMIRFLIERLVRRTWFGQFDEPYFVLSWLVMRCKLRPELAADAQQTA